MRFIASLFRTFFIAGGNAPVVDFDPGSAEVSEFQSRLLQNTIPNVTCGTVQCLNGGRCGVGQDYNLSTALCDCSAAVRNVGSPPQLQRFVGKSCEIAVKPTDYCVANINLFCVNGGNCRGQAANFLDVPCKCPNGFQGRYCEYKQADVQPECSLNCSGVGTCRHGFSPYGDSGASQYLPDLNQTQMFMHCVCDSGYAGPNCEYDYMKCGKNKYYCFHGSTCVTGGSGTQVCQCDYDVNRKVAGDYCEYKATDHCTNPIVIASRTSEGFQARNKIDVTSGYYPFCVNNGVCYKINGTETYYCKCPTNWEGTRCQVDTSTGRPSKSPAPTTADTLSAAPTTTASVTKRPSARKPTSKPARKPTRKPAKSPTIAPVQAYMSDAAQPGTPMAPGAVFGIVFGTVFMAVIFAVSVANWVRRVDYEQRYGEAVDHAENYSDAKEAVSPQAQETSPGPANDGSTHVISDEYGSERRVQEVELV